MNIRKTTTRDSSHIADDIGGVSQKSIVRIAQTTAGKDEAFYTTASILATENMRAAHVLKMYTRERIYKVTPPRFPLFFSRASRSRKVIRLESSSSVLSTTFRNQTCTKDCTRTRLRTLKGEQGCRSLLRPS